MSWLRLDEDFDGHKKLLALGDGATGDARRWTWTRILLYTSRHDSAEVPRNIAESIPKANLRYLRDCVRVGLLDDVSGRFEVHDWPIYANISVQEKVAYYLTHKNPDASANEVAKAIGGTREQILNEVKRFGRTSKGGTAEPASDRKPNQYGRTGLGGSESGTQPLPIPRQKPKPRPGGSTDVEVEAGLGSDSAREGLPDSQTPEDHDPSDPVAALLHVITDSDQGTETVLRNLRLPEYAYRQAIEELKPNGRSVKLAVKILHRIRDEITTTQAQILRADLERQATDAANAGQTWDNLEAKILNEHPDLVDVAADAFRAAKSLLGAMESRS